jgi:hypothetical protein
MPAIAVASRAERFIAVLLFIEPADWPIGISSTAKVITLSTSTMGRYFSHSG